MSVAVYDLFRFIFFRNEQARFFKFIVGDKCVDEDKAMKIFLEATHPDFKPRYSVLSDRAILHYMARKAIHIEPFFMANLGTNSYDVTLGPHYYRAKNPNRYEGAIYNIYSETSNQMVWGEPQEAILASEYCQQIGYDSLENILPEDRVIFIRPGETLLCHTNEMIGGTELPDRSAAITTGMHCRSSFGRSFIQVCHCSGLGDVGFQSYWTMEVSNNSTSFEIPLLVGHRIGQIEFDVTDSILLKGKQEYGAIGKYQHGNSIDSNRNNFVPHDMLQKLFKDREILFKMLPSPQPISCC